jgi:ornithine carbamoyltransferase
MIMKNLLTLGNLDLSKINELFSLAKKLKQEEKTGDRNHYLSGKSLGLIFAKSSTRTRVSFETGIYQLGGQGIFLSSRDTQLGRGETLADTAQTLSRYLDGIMIRTYEQQEVEELANFSSIPIINGLTDKYHPCQILSDLFTIQEKKGELKELKLAYVGDGNNIAQSLLLGAALTGLDISIAAPNGYQPKEEIVNQAKGFANESGTQLNIGSDPQEAVLEADVIYTDVWASMGQEEEAEAREKVFNDYQVTEDLLAKADKQALFMHCLPAHRGEEVTASVIDGGSSVVFDQAENRLHVQKAIMVDLLK